MRSEFRYLLGSVRNQPKPFAMHVRPDSVKYASKARPQMARRYELPDAVFDLVRVSSTSLALAGAQEQRSDWYSMASCGAFFSAAWRDMPERFGPWSRVNQRFCDWRKHGTFDLMFKRRHIQDGPCGTNHG